MKPERPGASVGDPHVSSLRVGEIERRGPVVAVVGEDELSRIQVCGVAQLVTKGTTQNVTACPPVAHPRRSFRRSPRP